MYFELQRIIKIQVWKTGKSRQFSKETCISQINIVNCIENWHKNEFGAVFSIFVFFTNLKNAQSLLSEYDSGDCVNSETIEVGCAKFYRVDKHG